MTLALKGTLPERLRMLATFQKGGSDMYRETMLEAADALLGNPPSDPSLLPLLRELRDYTARLDAASGAWFATRSYAKRPEAGDLRERLDALLGPYEDGRG